MLSLLKILLFGKAVLLTPSPVSIASGSLDIALETPIEAVTPGARIHIDVSKIIERAPDEGVLGVRRQIDQAFPPGSIRAELFGVDGSVVSMAYDGGSSIGESDVRLVLRASDGNPVGVKYDKISLHTDVELKEVVVYWLNYQH